MAPDSSLRSRIWGSLANIKFKALLTHKCSTKAGFWGRLYSFVLAFGSASSVAAWRIWDVYPTVWTLVVAFAQVLHIAKPHIPFLKNEQPFLEMSLRFEALYLKYERLWFDHEFERIDAKDAEDSFYKLRDEELAIEREHKHANCVRWPKTIQEAHTEVLNALNLNFPKEEKYGH